MPNVPVTIDRQRKRATDSRTAEVQLLESSSWPVTSQQTNDSEGDPDEFKQFTDQELQSKIIRLRGYLLNAFFHLNMADGGEKLRRMICRVEKELDRRRAARPRKGEDEDDFKKFTDQDLRLKIKRLQAISRRTPDGGKKLGKYICLVEKELDRRHAAGPRKVESDTGRRQEVQIHSVDDPYTFTPQENTSNHAPLIGSEATGGGLNPFASTYPEGQGETCTDLGAEEVKPTIPTSSGKKREETREKGKQSQIGEVLEHSLEFKVRQKQKFAEEIKETPKQEDRFTIEKCVAVLEAIKELTDMEKAQVLKLLKCRLNREIFMTTKSASVRLIWLRSEIYA